MICILHSNVPVSRCLRLFLPPKTIDPQTVAGYMRGVYYSGIVCKISTGIMELYAESVLLLSFLSSVVS